MHPALNLNLFLVKEHVGLFKAAQNFDVFDPATGQMVMQCREEHLGLVTRILRFTDYKRLTPFNVQIRTVDGQPLVRVSRGILFLKSYVKVHDGDDTPVGAFRQKFFSIGGAFTVVDDKDQPVCTLKGKWTGWEFKFLSPQGHELALVTKKWAGIGKEMFTSADNYVLKIADDVPADHPMRELILAAVMCIDMVLKE